MKKPLLPSAVVLLALLSVAVGLAWVFGPTRVCHPLYWAWTQGWGRYSARNWELFVQDARRFDIVSHRSSEQLVHMFPHYQDGSAYSPESYRRSGTKSFGESAQFMWLEGGENDWGYYIVLIPGQPPSLHLAKG